jgi:methanogenic corrinoid protein MtbC1
MGNKKLSRVNPAAEETPADQLVQGLFETIERELIPRLLLAHRARGLLDSRDARPLPTSEEIADLAARALAQDAAGCLERVEALVTGGLLLESVLLHFVAPSARLLGEYWDTDRNTYTEVTAGIATFQSVVRTLGSRVVPSAVPTRGQVLLTTAPGEQHTRGLVMLNEFMVKAGWSVVLEPGLTHAEIVQAVSTGKVEMVGLTVSNPRLLEPLARLVAAIKKQSLQRDVLIIVGGSVDLTEFAEANDVMVSSDLLTAVARLDSHVSNR